MPRSPRTDIGGLIYHVLNRSNARIPIFTTPKDYAAFESVLEEAQQRTLLRVYAYCVMPNHWHLSVSPNGDGDLSSFVRWLSMTHTQRWHVAHGTTGAGHLYQGRYKSFLISEDNHFLRVCKYIERNPARAGLVARAEDWQWSSIWRRQSGDTRLQHVLSPWPVSQPNDYLAWVNTPESSEELGQIRESVNRGQPYGSDRWREHMIECFSLASTVRTPGRPRSIQQ